MRQRVLSGFVLALWLLAAAATADEPAAGARPNVLFIAVDDLRPALGCYGDQTALTPHIDRLAATGVRFDRAYCQEAVCAPSRLSLLTGLRPDTIRVWDLKTHFRDARPDAVTLPQLFREHGYQTRSIGKIFHGSGPPAKDPQSWSEPPLFDVNGRDYALPAATSTQGKQMSIEAADVEDDVHRDGQVCSAAEQALRTYADGGKPFFLAVGFRKPHLPFCAPKKYWDLYDRDAIPLPHPSAPPTDAPELATRSWVEVEGYRDVGDTPIPEAKVRELRHGYYACISFVDALVGRLLTLLEERGLGDKTIVVLWGDHGYHIGELGLWTKANTFELATRVPLIVRAPGRQQAGAAVEGLVEFVDVYPSLAELCGLPAPKDLEGASFVPLLADPERPWKSAVFSQYPRHRTKNRHEGHGDVMGYAIRTDRHRYVEWRDWETKQVLAHEMYDHATDPLETVNVAADPKQAAVVAGLSERLQAGWRGALPPAAAAVP